MHLHYAKQKSIHPNYKTMFMKVSHGRLRHIFTFRNLLDQNVCVYLIKIIKIQIIIQFFSSDLIFFNI